MIDGVDTKGHQRACFDWATPEDVKRDIGNASILNDGPAVFNIGGNKQCGACFAVAAAQDAWAVREAEWRAGDSAMWADERGLPTGLFEVGSASRVVGEQTLELRQ